LIGLHARTQSPPPEIANALENVVNNSLPSGFSNPGVVMGVSVPGQWSWFGAAGDAIAGITAGQPLTAATPTTRFRVGSISKMMVATAILKIEQDGLLSIDDPISMYLRSTLVTDTIASSGTVYIKNLLNHTSGIANSGDNTGCQTNVLSNPAGSHSLEEAIFCGCSLGELFAPGTNWSYSNTNYSILAMIIQNVTGLSAAEYITQNIITPLNLTNTEIPTTDQISGPHMGCYWNIGSWIDLTIVDPTTYWGWADVVSSTGDLLNFYDSLLNGAIINNTQLTKMETIDAAANNYGLGMEFSMLGGEVYHGHYGEVANSSALYHSTISSSLAPSGYFVAYNYNTQGVNMSVKMNVPVYQVMMSNVGIDELLSSTDIFLVPNPAKEKLTLCLMDADIQEGSIKITDMQGRTVFTLDQKNLPLSTEIDLRDMQNGTYLLTFTSSKLRTSKRFIID
jgi:D-alanyl-D-alanine carboxypeptidase